MTAFNVVELKSDNLEELGEVVTHAEYHPKNSDMFLFSSSKGAVHVCDLRESTQFPRCAQKYEIYVDPAKKHFFTDIINSISYAVFTKDGNNIFSRDYIHTKVWDVRKSDKPIKAIQVTDYIEKKLCDLYDNERIFDKFELHGSPCSNYFFTGCYNGSYHVIDKEANSNTTMEASFNHKRAKPTGEIRYYGGKRLQPLVGAPALNVQKKVLCGAWHPKENLVAVANHNCIYLFNQEKKLK